MKSYQVVMEHILKVVKLDPNIFRHLLQNNKNYHHPISSVHSIFSYTQNINHQKENSKVSYTPSDYGYALDKTLTIAYH